MKKNSLTTAILAGVAGVAGVAGRRGSGRRVNLVVLHNLSSFRLQSYTKHADKTLRTL